MPGNLKQRDGRRIVGEEKEQQKRQDEETDGRPNCCVGRLLRPIQNPRGRQAGDGRSGREGEQIHGQQMKAENAGVKIEDTQDGEHAGPDASRHRGGKYASLFPKDQAARNRHRQGGKIKEF